MTAWDRTVSPPGDHFAADYIDSVAPDVLFLLAVNSDGTGDGRIVDVEWPATLAAIGAARDVAVVFTSSVMVYGALAGPFTVDSPVDTAPGYGAAKLAAESAILEAGGRVVRLGWQIGNGRDGNHMVSHLDRQAAAGPIGASRRWLPACSFLEDTASALVQTVDLPPGVYLADGNSAWSYCEIVLALRTHLDREWDVIADDTFVQDQRMMDLRLAVATLDSRLDALEI